MVLVWMSWAWLVFQIELIGLGSKEQLTLGKLHNSTLHESLNMVQERLLIMLLFQFLGFWSSRENVTTAGTLGPCKLNMARLLRVWKSSSVLASAVHGCARLPLLLTAVLGVGCMLVLALLFHALSMFSLLSRLLCVHFPFPVTLRHAWPVRFGRLHQM